MKLLVVVGACLIMAGCTANRVQLVSTAEHKLPESLCADHAYRICTLSGTYNECLAEVRSYVSPCSLKSFPKSKNHYSKDEFLKYNRAFGNCLLDMHISDRASEGKLEANRMCEERGFYTIHEKKN